MNSETRTEEEILRIFIESLEGEFPTCREAARALFEMANAAYSATDFNEVIRPLNTGKNTKSNSEE